MARILALDYGTKRTGIAVTDELQLIASGLTTVDTKVLMGFLKEYLAKENVELILLGEPKRMDYSASQVEVEISKFRESLEKITSIPIQRVDERFTSKMAAQTLITGGVKKKKRQNKALLDEISATIILQSYLYNL
ncbi:Holliday junction resolvase RuvX [Leeuwenhoekiella sp. MAR_2009_132]|uniref:Holliday junction resolvase RuvX n=1 Tax=Leeuwenhoekiella sp. MAR_2009_132 TaxID=1392489 RepID=UPI00048B97AF|nr:Holliday junction resolvase RuvX [Leeuwenhoekiella sp. MAR_2009_132]